VLKAFSNITRRGAVLAVATTMVLMVGALSAFATPTQQVARTTTVQTIMAKCCVLFSPSVRINEPSTIAPVIVTFGADYNLSGTAQLGLSVNGGPCVAYGPFVGQEPVLIPGSSSITVSGTWQWIVFPSDGLVKGLNTFQPCGGGFGQSVTLNIGFTSLSVQISK
jgi:hypothetical protein